MNNLKKVICIILTVVTIFSVFSSSNIALASKYNEYLETQNYKEKLLTETVKTNDNQNADIICEVIDKRNEFSKTYLRTDGSYTQIFSNSPLHFKKNKEWEDIDNRLVAENESIKNSSGKFDIEFPETLSENGKITVENGSESIAFSVQDINASNAVIENTTTEKDIITEDLSKKISGITYKNIEENTDIQYIVSPVSVKENIIVHDSDGLKGSYSFNIEKGDLDVTLDSENNLIFKNSKNQTVFTIPAPIMTDSDNAVSYDIDVSIKNIEAKTMTLTYIPSEEWLNASDRVYPVTIDPVIALPDLDDNLIQDTVIVSDTQNPTNSSSNYSNSVEGYIADTDTLKGNVLVKLNMDFFNCFKQSDIEITDVNYYGNGYIIGGNALVKPITGSWDCQTITYNDVYPSDSTADPVITYENTIVDYFTGVSADITEPELINLNFNITKLFKEWLNGERSNYGFAIVPENSSAYGLFYLAGDYTPSDTPYTFNSYCSVDYVDTSGSNDSFEYLTQEIGRAGTVNVNIFSRGLSLSRSDLSMDGLRMPASIAFNYYSSFVKFLNIYNRVLDVHGLDEIALCYGKNWLPSYVQMIAEPTSGQFQFFTGEGTLVTFNKGEETVEDETTGTTETKVIFEADETGDSGYCLELIDQTKEISFINLKLTTPYGETAYFNETGLVIEIREPEANADGTYDSITIAYSETNPFKIDFVSDGIGRNYDFYYNEETGLLSDVVCAGASAVPYKAGTTDVDLKVTYTYDENQNLTGVTYPDGKTVTYTYNSNGNLIKVKNIDNYNIQYNYDSLNKVTSIAEYADTTPGNSIVLTQLGNRQVKVTDSFAGTETYQFGRDGKLHYTFDENGNYIKSSYAPASDEDVLEFDDWTVASENLLKNGSFEEVSSSITNSGGAKHWSNAFERVACDTALNGNYAYKISSESAITEYLEHAINIKNIQPYTLSAYVKSETAENTDAKLYIKIEAKNANGDTTTKLQSIETADDWTRFSVTFNPVSENGTFAVNEITACIGFENSCGTFYVDDVQLETGKGTADYNLIENGSFNHTIDNAPTKWSDSEVSQKVIYGKNVNAVKLNAGLPCYTENSDGTYTLNDSFSAVTQNVKINGKKGEIYSVGGWFNGLFDDNYISSNVYTEYGDIAPQLTNSTAQIKVTYSYNETTGTQQTVTESFAVDFQPHNENWQYVNDSFVLKADVESVDVTVVTQNIAADSYATGIELTLNDSAMSLVEDEETTDTTESTESTETTETNETTDTVVEKCTCGCEDCLYGENCPCTGVVNGNCQCPECLRKVTSTKDNFGNTLSNKTTSGALYIETLSTYTSDGNQLSSYTDENGNVYEYNYDSLNSILKSVSTLNNDGQVLSDISYAYDAAGNVVSISSNVSETATQTLQFVYVNDRLNDIITSNEVYRIIYDVWGQVLSVNIVSSDSNSENLIPLVQYTYYTGKNRTQVKTVAYNNSPSVQNIYEYSYYDDGTVKTIKLNNDEKHNINYDNIGVLTSIENVGGRTVEYTDSNIYIYSNDGSLVYVSATNDDGLTTEENYGVIYEETETLYDYNSDTGISTQTNGLNISEKYNLEQTTKTDWFGRENISELTVFDISDETPVTKGSVVTEYIYPEKEDGKTSSTIEEFINKTYNESDTEVNVFDGYSYEYTSQRKISAEKTLKADGTTTDKYSYKYDKLGQLIRFNDAVANRTYTYSYDSNGNILSKSEYPYTLSETLGTATSTITYGYDTQWKDLLTTVGNKTITYDNIGNPISYLGATLTWEGRTLISYEDETNIIEYKYDENGMRYYTTITNKEDGLVGSYKYVWIDGKLISIVFVSNGSTQTAKYLYNDNDEPVGMVVTDAEGTLLTYYYLKNAQGDITNIISASGGKLVEFTYDVFGNQTVHYQADPSTIMGMMNLVEQVMVRALTPFGYRGYCYDTYSGLYYLQSRYYDPQTGRFINTDDTNYLNTTGTVLGCNLFAYCENDPVNRVDPKGTIYVSTNLYYTKIDKHSYFITAKMLHTNKDCNVIKLSPYFIFKNERIQISAKLPAIKYIINKKILNYLAKEVFTAARYINPKSLKGRTIKGIQFEILVHYIFYIALKDRKPITYSEDKDLKRFRVIDIGAPNTNYVGYDSNAAVFESYKNLYSVFETKLVSGKYTAYVLYKALKKFEVF